MKEPAHSPLPLLSSSISSYGADPYTYIHTQADEPRSNQTGTKRGVSAMTRPNATEKLFFKKIPVNIYIAGESDGDYPSIHFWCR